MCDLMLEWIYIYIYMSDNIGTYQIMDDNELMIL